MKDMVMGRYTQGTTNQLFLQIRVIFPFGRNVVPFTDFLLRSCTTVELCWTAKTTILWAHCVCFQIHSACYLICAAVLCPVMFKKIEKKIAIELSSCCFSSDEKNKRT